MGRLLILAGTSEARQIATDLPSFSEISTILSFSAPLQKPFDFCGELRIGGFGGEDGFHAFLKHRKITAILDALHPFAAKMAARAANASEVLGLTYLKLCRPPWHPLSDDLWIEVNSAHEAAAQIPDHSVVFIGSGRQSLPAFANVKAQLICRQLTKPETPFPFANGCFLHGIPPFDVDSELALFQKLSVTHLVSKNAGGKASYPKIEAARRARIPVLMINRPALPLKHKHVQTVKDTITWLKTLK